MSESVDAIERAIATLEFREADVPQSLLQLQGAPRLPSEAKATIKSFLALPGSDLGVHEANAYEFQSGGVVALLEKLRLKFQGQRVGLEKEDKDNAAKKTPTRSQRLADALIVKADLR